MNATVLIRVDAGADVGLGHLQRCLALGSAFAEAGCALAFLVNGAPFVRDRVLGAGWPARLLNGMASWTEDDASAVVEEAANRHATIVLVDSDKESPAYLRRLSAAGLFVCTVEDEPVADVAADLLLNGDAHAELLAYGARPGTTRLLGPSFAPLAPHYWTADVPDACAPASRVLITLGGADPYNLMPSLLREVAGLPEPVHLVVVIGPFADNRRAIDEAAAPLGARVTIHHAPDSLFPVIAGCDLALTGAGQTLYELAALGRPALAIKIAANQVPQIAEFERHGAAICAGAATDAGLAARAGEMLRALSADAPRLRAMAKAGRRYIDGQGARRAAAAILARALTMAPARRPTNSTELTN